MTKFGVVYIEGEKVIVSSEGFCNKKKIIAHYNAIKKTKTYVIEINGRKYKLGRILAHVFLDNTINLIEGKDERNTRIDYINNNGLDIRLDNIQILNQTETLIKNHSILDDIYLIDLNGNLIESGMKSILADKYKVNKGTITDVLKGKLRYCNITKPDGKKVKCTILKAIEYNRDTVKDVIKEKLNTQYKIYKHDEEVIQIDINGDYRIMTYSEAQELIKNDAGLRMCLYGKRLTASGYIWIGYDVYLKNNNIIQEKLKEVKSNRFYGGKIQLKKLGE